MNIGIPEIKPIFHSPVRKSLLSIPNSDALMRDVGYEVNAPKEESTIVTGYKRAALFLGDICAIWCVIFLFQTDSRLEAIQEY